jgi:putative oxidoreductase
MTMQLSQRQLALSLIVGRILLASLFILGGINKVLNYAPTLQFMQKAGLEPSALLLPLTIILELGGGLLVAFGRKGASFAALTLAIFTLATNIFFHDFWNMTGEAAQLQLSLFFKNLSIAGGLLFVAAAEQRRVQNWK